MYQSTNRGKRWRKLTKGLQKKNVLLNVNRQAMAVDDPEPCGIYIGTSTGQVFHSRNEGDLWELLVDYLPPIYSVECAVVQSKRGTTNTN